jgi:hypothetical protein
MIAIIRVLTVSKARRTRRRPAESALRRAPTRAADCCRAADGFSAGTALGIVTCPSAAREANAEPDTI